MSLGELTEDVKKELTEDIKKRSRWGILMGILTAILGMVLIAYPLATATATTLFLGWLLILAGVAELIFALHSHGAGKFFWKVFRRRDLLNRRRWVGLLSH